MKVVRELGLERRKTVRSISIAAKKKTVSNLVREDRKTAAAGQKAVVLFFFNIFCSFAATLIMHNK